MNHTDPVSLIPWAAEGGCLREEKMHRCDGISVMRGNEDRSDE